MQDAQDIAIRFTGQQLDYVFRVLGKCPADEVEALRASIRQQVDLHNFNLTQAAQVGGTGQKAESPTAGAAGLSNGAAEGQGSTVQ